MIFIKKLKKMNKLIDVELLYENDRWDGPLEGLCKYKGEFYHYIVDELGEWEQWDDEDDDKCIWKSRTWKIYEIEPWQLAYELYWHAIFCNNVAAYYPFDFALQNERFKYNLKNKGIFRKFNFWKKQRKEYKKIDYSKNKCIGWVDEENFLISKRK